MAIAGLASTGGYALGLAYCASVTTLSEVSDAYSAGSELFAICRTAGWLIECVRSVAIAMSVSAARQTPTQTAVALAAAGVAWLGGVGLYIMSTEDIRPYYCHDTGSGVYEISRCTTPAQDVPPAHAVRCADPTEGEFCGCVQFHTSEETPPQSWSLSAPYFEIEQVRGQWQVARTSIGFAGDFVVSEDAGTDVRCQRFDNRTAHAYLTALSHGSTPPPHELPMQLARIEADSSSSDGMPNVLVLRAGENVTRADDVTRSFAATSVVWTLPFSNCCGPIERELQVTFDSYAGLEQEYPDVVSHQAGQAGLYLTSVTDAVARSMTFVRAYLDPIRTTDPPNDGISGYCYINRPPVYRDNPRRYADVMWEGSGTNLIRIFDSLDFGSGLTRLYDPATGRRLRGASTHRLGVLTPRISTSQKYYLSEVFPDAQIRLLESADLASQESLFYSIWDESKTIALHFAQSTLESAPTIDPGDADFEADYPFTGIDALDADGTYMRTAFFINGATLPRINEALPLPRIGGQGHAPRRELTCRISPRVPIGTNNQAADCSRPGRPLRVETGVRAAGYNDDSRTWGQAKMVIPIQCDARSRRCYRVLDPLSGRLLAPAQTCGDCQRLGRPANQGGIAPGSDPDHTGYPHPQLDYCTGPIPQQIFDE